MLGVGVLEQLSQLQRVLADLLHGCEQEAGQRDVDHPLQQSAGLEEERVLVELHEARELQAGVGVVVAVLGVDLEVGLLVAETQETERRVERPGSDRWGLHYAHIAYSSPPSPHVESHWTRGTLKDCRGSTFFVSFLSF